ncbi:MAG: SIR2 family protein [Pirellulaceae bacterium]
MKNEMLLLGAGASVEAGIPSAHKMTRVISDEFRKNSRLSRIGHLISFVIGGLLFEAGKNNRDPLSSEVNVEDLFNAVQMLADRHNLEASPFVGSWHAMIDEFDKEVPSRFNSGSLGRSIYKLVADEIREALAQSPSSFERDHIDTAIQNAISKGVESAAKGHSFYVPSFGSAGRAVENYVKEASKLWRDRLHSAHPSGSSDIDKDLARLVDDRQVQPGEGRIFHRANELMIAVLRKKVWITDPEQVAYLQPIIELMRDRKRLVVATLNYDNCIELLASKNGVQCDTGISRWSQSGSFKFPEDGLCLIKLHGSIDWVRHRSNSESSSHLPHAIIRQATPEEISQEHLSPAVIFGQRNKLTAEGPFLDLLQTFRDELFKADRLTVVGYSFADPHINVFITQWINSRSDRVIRVINGPDSTNNPNSYIKSLLELHKVNANRVIFLHKNAGEGLASHNNSCNGE